MPVSPDVAARWLEKNPINRPLDNDTVALYASIMKKGEWNLSSEAIAFCHPFTDKDGTQYGECLINGQHRLWAIIESGVTIEATVWWGCEPEEAKLFDKGRPRSIADTLHYDHKEIKEPTRAATSINSILRSLMAYRAKAPTWIVDRILFHFGEEIQLVSTHRKVLSHRAPATIATALFTGVILDADKTAVFIDRMHTGVGFTETDPARALRFYLDDQRAAQAKDSKDVVLYKSLHAIMAEIDGKQVKRLQPHVDYLGEARRRLKRKIEAVVREIHGGSMPIKFYDPKNAIHPKAEKADEPEQPMASAAS